MRRYLLPLLWVCAFVVAACSAVAPTLRAESPAAWDLGARNGVSIGVSAQATRGFRTRQAAPAGAMPATVGDVASYLFELRRTSDNGVAGSFSSALPQARFTGVPDGTYYLKADARNGLSQSLVQGGPQTSLNTVTVASPSVVYSAGGGLSVTLNLLNGQGLILPVHITAPYTAGFGAMIYSPTYNTMATVQSTVSSLEFRNALDGTYEAWGFAHDGTGKATPAMPAGTATVSGGATTVTGSLNVVSHATVSRVAGGGVGDGGPAAKSGMVNQPRGLTLDPAGNLYIADQLNHRIRMIPAASGTHFGQSMQGGGIYTIAGSGVAGFGGDGGAARQAQLSSPSGVAIDAVGNVFIADKDNHRIRVICATPGTYFGVAMTAGRAYTIAGTGGTAYNGDNIVAGTATMNQPFGVAFDSIGNLFVAEVSGHRIRMICQTANTYYTQVMAAGNIYTVAGTGTSSFSADGSAATSSGLGSPSGVAVDAAGTLIICDVGSQRLRIVTNNTVSAYGAVRTAGFLYSIAGTGSVGNGGSGGAATATALSNPVAVYRHPGNGDLYIVDSANNKIRRRSTAGADGLTPDNLYTIAGTTAGYSGDGAAATSAQLDQPFGIAVDSAGHCFVSDKNNHRVRVLANATTTLFQQPVTNGFIHTVTGNGTITWAGEECPIKEARFASTKGLAKDAFGNVLIADDLANVVRMYCRVPGTYYGKTMTAGNIYRVAGIGTGSAGYSGDAGPATSAQLNMPRYVAVDAGGNLYISDRSNNVIRQVTPAGTITTYATGLANPEGLAFDSVGICYVADSGNNRLVTVPGGGGAAVPFVTGGISSPGGVAVDDAGTIYLANAGSHTVLKITPGGVASIFAGQDASMGTTGDGGLATSAQLQFPQNVMVDAMHVYIAGANRVRMVEPSGRIYRVAGTGSAGATAVGGEAAQTVMMNPWGMAMLPGDGLVLAVHDTGTPLSALYQVR